MGGDVTAKAAETGDLAGRLNKLFEVIRRPNTPPLSNAAAAAAITDQTGVSISPAYLWQLRNGLKDNPTVQHLRAIAEYFGVPASYLIDRDPNPRIDAQLDLLQALRDSGVRDLATRASGLTPQALNSLAAIIDHLRELEHLPPIAPQGDDQSDGSIER
ncbi:MULTISPECIES: helix-turn-helix domain-containing protein [unclassified Mycobacterium]|uniref:helix-turn-helix domain-containing protein n=1 Tax=unclassified Mycobacterium TaxID=2642494 RepID=UPI0007FCF335|nr:MULTISPECIES: helix-turn-helix domain-containing protein [unclassified Mycobacterium]OBH00699.1 XRE family transcriptional regulator [Mycobacterium sp. E2699]OBI50592.1 XRE family transcriptional regulator [Mycobacterium sp. E787]